MYTSGSTLDSTVINFNSTLRQFNVSTYSNSKAGTYSIAVTAALGNYVTNIGTLTITLVITANPCSVTSIKQPNTVAT